MDQQPESKKRNFLSNFTRHYSGPLIGVALSALSAWTIVIGLKGLAGFEVNQRTALVDLLGIVIVIGVARWFKMK